MTSEPFRAVVSDLDGTLLNGQHILGNYTIETLNKLAKKDIDIVLATGRNHIDVSSILNKVNVSNAVMITSNGARIHDLNGNLLYSENLPEAIVLDIYKIPFDRSKVCLNTYQDDGWFINVDVPELAKYHQDSGFQYQVVDFSQHHGRATEKVFFISKDPQDLVEVEHYLNAHYGEVANIVYSSLTSIEVMSKNVSKGNALAHLLQGRDYDLQDCIAFGDGMNDVEMLSRVGKGCIMANADSRLKQACPQLEIIGSNADEAVATYLHTIFGLD